MNTKEKVNAFLRVFDIQSRKLDTAFSMDLKLDGSGECGHLLFEAIYSDEETTVFCTELMDKLNLTKEDLKLELQRRAIAHDSNDLNDLIGDSRYDCYLMELYYWEII